MRGGPATRIKTRLKTAAGQDAGSELLLQLRKDWARNYSAPRDKDESGLLDVSLEHPPCLVIGGAILRDAALTLVTVIKKTLMC